MNMFRELTLKVAFQAVAATAAIAVTAAVAVPAPAPLGVPPPIGRPLGTFNCDDGSCNNGVEGTAASTGVVEALTWLKAHPQSSRYQPNDYLAICDSVSCIYLIYQANGNWLPWGGAFKDNHRYKNGSQSVSYNYSGDSNSGNYSYSVSGYWTFTDYYSDGSYVGSYIDEYTVTGVSTVFGGVAFGCLQLSCHKVYP